MFLIVYRPHNTLSIDTRHIGPFDTKAEAYDYLCDCLPGVGVFDETHTIANQGCKYVVEIEAPVWTGVHGADRPVMKLIATRRTRTQTWFLYDDNGRAYIERQGRDPHRWHSP